MTLASNVGHEAEENTIGTISKAEAREALRKHKGNIWASVTECVEGRQQKVGQIITRNYRSGLDDICLYSTMYVLSSREMKNCVFHGSPWANVSC